MLVIAFRNNNCSLLILKPTLRSYPTLALTPPYHILHLALTPSRPNPISPKPPSSPNLHLALTTILPKIFTSPSPSPPPNLHHALPQLSEQARLVDSLTSTSGDLSRALDELGCGDTSKAHYIIDETKSLKHNFTALQRQISERVKSLSSQDDSLNLHLIISFLYF